MPPPRLAEEGRPPGSEAVARHPEPPSRGGTEETTPALRESETTSPEEPLFDPRRAPSNFARIAAAMIARNGATGPDVPSHAGSGPGRVDLRDEPIGGLGKRAADQAGTRRSKRP